MTTLFLQDMEMKWCRYCQRWVRPVVTKKSFNWLIAIFLAVMSFGILLIVYFIISAFSGSGGKKACPICNAKM